MIAEAYRITRPGGYFYPVDFRSGGDKGRAYGQYRRWWDHRWNTEVWSREYHTLDFEGELVKAGFTMNKEAKAGAPQPVPRAKGGKSSTKGKPRTG